MSFKELDNLVRVGLLKTESGDQGEFDGLVKSGRTRLNDARTPGLSSEGRFDLAYNAAHAFALAALRWHGFRPDNKRYVVFQSLEHSLGLKPELWRVLDKCHSVRNLAEYEGHFDADEQLLKDLLRVTETVGQAVEKLGPVAAKRKS
jgi:hypothetical protein